jgi:hypothetical protein
MLTHGNEETVKNQLAYHAISQIPVRLTSVSQCLTILVKLIQKETQTSTYFLQDHARP